VIAATFQHQDINALCRQLPRDEARSEAAADDDDRPLFEFFDHEMPC